MLKKKTRKITIYKGAVRVLYADGFTLEKDRVVPNVKKEIYSTDEEFYPFMRKLIHINTNTVLPDEGEAMWYMQNVIQHRQEIIREVLMNPYMSQEAKAAFFKRIAELSSCTYLEPSDIHANRLVNEKDLKQYLKGKRESYE